MPAVSDTSPIFNLACIGRLNLLREQFGTISVPHGVEAELREIPDLLIQVAIEDARRAGGLLVQPATQLADLGDETVVLPIIVLAEMWAGSSMTVISI